MHERRMFAPVLALVAAIAVCARAGEPAWTTVETRWYELLIGEGKAGWMSIGVDRADDLWRTRSESRLTIERGPVSVEVGMESTFVERADGTPVEATTIQQMSAQTVRTRWVFTPEHVEQTTWRGGAENAAELPLPEGSWMPPHAADEYANARRRAGADEITVRTIDPQNGLVPITSTSRRTGTATYDLGDRSIPVTTWTTVTDLMPIEGTEYISEDGHMVYQEIQTGFGKMVTRLVDEATAKGDGGLAPELLVETFVRVEPIPNVDHLRRAVMILRAKQGAMPEMPTAGAQRAEPGEASGTVRLVVDLDDPQPATAEELADQAYRSASTMVSSDDAMVRKLAARATRDAGDDPAARAEALRRAVHAHITRKGLQTAFASAAETARTREGDCSEHAVLLCAMLRAEGIPARVASGLVYVDEFGSARHVFGWHMWTQALIDGRWRDLDATLPITYHAGHILTGTSALADGTGPTDLAGMIVLIGNLEADVIEKGYGERSAGAPE